MSANCFGCIFKLTSFGESHGCAMGVVIEGCPAGLDFDKELLNRWLKRRRPGVSSMVSGRLEEDRPEILSGVFEKKTLGTPIAVIVRNQQAQSQDYQEIKNHPRIGHADDVWQDKFGHRDHRGGGRASGRETLSRVIGGAFAQMLVNQLSPLTKVDGFVRQVGEIVLEEGDTQKLESFLLQAKKKGESYGGLAEISINAPPRGLGQPVFHKLKSDLAGALMSVGATCGFEVGEGFAASQSKGTSFHNRKDSPVYGGLRGGMSTGEKISLRVAFKPTSSIGDLAKKGRHDPCIVLRALPVLEAMVYVVLADHLLWSRLDCVRTLFKPQS